MKNIFFISIATFGLSLFATAQDRLYVNASATGGNNGQSWGDAFTDLQPALQTAQAGDEVWVAEGAYFPTSTTDRNISFEPKSGTQLYGGFAGNETALGQRDWAVHITTLSGDIGTVGDTTDNSFNVVYLFQPDSSTVFDGFTVCFGQADDVAGAGSTRDRAICGGGLYIEAGNWDAFPNIQNCHFWHNTSNSFGGAVMVNGASDANVAPRFVGCRFEENRSVGSGGGLARFGGSWTERGKEFEGCHFSQNRALVGGGLYYRDTQGPNTVALYGCSFENNSAASHGGGAFFLTGKSGKSGLHIQNCGFEANNGLVGAAIEIFNNGNYFDGEAVIDSCVFFRNISLSGGNFSSIIYTDQLGTPQTVVKLANTKVEDNFSEHQIFLFAWLDAKVLVENTLLARNIAVVLLKQTEVSSSEVRNTVFRSNENSLIGDHFLYGNETFVKYSNCLFEKNKTTSAGGLFRSSGLQKFTVRNSAFLYGDHPFDDYIRLIATECDSLFLFNTIITDSITKWSFAIVDVVSLLSHNSFGFIDCNDQFPNVTCGPGNLINLDPLFRDTANHDYSLLPCSPLINAGSNAAAAGILTDLAGNPRIQGGTVDIGAYEAPAFALAAAPEVQPACVGTSNGSISLSPVFGCEPYTYDWSPQAGNGPELNGLPPGPYIFTITDGSGRQILDTVVVASAPQPSLALASTDVQCGTTAGGTLSASVAGGTAPFQYTWLPSAVDTALLLQQQPGDYALTVVDANGCQDSASASIALLGMLTPMIGGQTISCFSAADGWLSLTPATGAGPFQWQWEGWSGTDSVAQPLGPGNYSVTVTDAYGCTASNTFPAMTEPGLIVIGTGSSAQTQTSPPNGAAVVTTISGGTSPFYFEWEEGSTTQAIAGLNAGTYTVTVTDENGCAAVAEVVVEQMISSTEELAGLALMIYPNPALDWV
ncbi:MAG: SprB repeat-containing protein, partial [Saprospiraceae bacterium]|nr:SprB repeat-containing protein [Saprospiraceae bacterium]